MRKTELVLREDFDIFDPRYDVLNDYYRVESDTKNDRGNNIGGGGGK